MDKIPQDYQLNPAAEISQKNDINLSTQKLLAGGETVVGWQESKAEKGERILWINLTHTFPQTNAGEICMKEIKKAGRQGFKKLQSTHRKWWNAYYPASFITLPEIQKKTFTGYRCTNWLPLLAVTAP